MDRHKQRLIDSAVKILDDEVASNIENAKEQLPKDAHDDLKDAIHQVKHKFVDDLIVSIDYVLKSLLFQPDKTVIFDCIIKYLDTFIKEFDILYSPSYKQANSRSIQVDYGFAKENLAFIFEIMYPSEKRVKEFEKEGYYDIILYIIDKFMVPFKFLSGEIPNVPQIHMRRYLKYHRRNIDLAFVNWHLTSTMPGTFIKIYMTAVRDFFVSVRPTSSTKDKSEIDEFFKALGKGPKTFKKKKRGTK